MPRFGKDDWVRHARTGLDGRVREVLWHARELGWCYLVAVRGVPIQLHEFEIEPFYGEKGARG